ncbi:MAG: hypothetical protein FE78DRAFT_67455 [Acidomyces sp. 'richmondensis']|nr:MAG: hypothetical protein FE78DRAFT_67455 [Acidomyces sp. 'richmondensis']
MQVRSRKNDANKSHLSTFLRITALAVRVFADKDFPNNSQDALRIYQKAYSLTKSWLEEAERRFENRNLEHNATSVDGELRRILCDGGTRSLAVVLARVGPMGWRMLRTKNDKEAHRAVLEVAKEMHYLLSIIIEDSEREIERLIRNMEVRDKERHISYAIACPEGYEEQNSKNPQYISKCGPTFKLSRGHASSKKESTFSNRRRKSKPRGGTFFAGSAKTRYSASSECTQTQQGYHGLPPPPIGHNFIHEHINSSESDYIQSPSIGSGGRSRRAGLCDCTSNRWGQTVQKLDADEPRIRSI